MNRFASSLVLLVLAGCRPSDGPSPPVAAPVATAPAVSATASAASAVEPAASAVALPGSPCGGMAEANLKAISVDPDARPGTQVDLAQACYPTPRGAWGLRLVSWKREGEPDSFPTFAGSLEVVHFQKGVESVWRPVNRKGAPMEGIDVHANLNQSDILPPQLADLDGDGEPEIFLAIDQKIHEGPFYREAFLLGAKGDAVAPVAGLPGALEEMKDVDGDGRMDFIYNPYREERELPCSGFGYQWQGPSFLAHGLGGGKFSLDDRVAKDFLRKSCPSAPRPVKRPKSDRWQAVEREVTPPELCARLWGKSEAEALGFLRSECKAPRNEEEACKAPPGVCSDYVPREQAVKRSPPLTVK